jgi:tetratricopeptide (TPR) repeat protein
MPTFPDSREPQPRPPKKGVRSLRRFFSRDSREHMWALLDHLDARPALKKALLIGVPVLAVAVGLGAWGYLHWARTNSIRIARQWLDAGRLDRAAIAVRQALTTEPGLPASWRLASELAWRKGNRAASVDYARQAAAVSRYQSDDVLAWAETSILSDDVEQAREADGYLDPTTARVSPRALRLAGEIARRSQRFEDARDRFQAALEEDTKAGAPFPAVDEIPLGIVCLQTGSTGDRTRGQALLAKWASDPNWGIDALRALLADAVAHRERESTTQWAESLRLHPRFTLGDVPACLQALADSDPVRYQAMLAPLEDKSRSSPTQAAQLLGWLTQIGQGAESVRWGETLDPAAGRKPPIALGIAEALRATHRWADLQAWADRADWGHELASFGWAYEMLAARQLGDGPKADSLWRSLYTDGRASPAHALFLGDSLYAWGYPKEAAELLWAAADRPDLAYQALGTLARLYQVQHDAVGQYRAFSRLNSMRPGDRGIANNFVYFAALTDMGGQTRIEAIAEDNFAHEPGNTLYRSTYAFVLVLSGQATRAMTLMEPVSRDWKKSPAVAFAYGSALASLGRRSEAKEVFDSLNPRDLDLQEAEWVRMALGGENFMANRNH